MVHFWCVCLDTVIEGSCLRQITVFWNGAIMIYCICGCLSHLCSLYKVCIFGFKCYSFCPFNLKCAHCSWLIVIPPLACLSDVLGPVWCCSHKWITARKRMHLTADSVMGNKVRDFSFLKDWCESRDPIALKQLIPAWLSALGWVELVWSFLLVKNTLEQIVDRWILSGKINWTNSSSI